MKKKNKRIFAILIGRAGSSAFPGKNILKINGKHLFEYPIIEALKVKKIEKLFIISAFVKTWISGIIDSTYDIFPIAPKIAPTLNSILEPKSEGEIKNTIQEIIKDKYVPINNFKNNQPPSLSKMIL